VTRILAGVGWLAVGSLAVTCGLAWDSAELIGMGVFDIGIAAFYATARA
jgi:hypothetical protein